MPSTWTIFPSFILSFLTSDAQILLRLSEQEATWDLTESERERVLYDGQCKTPQTSQVRVYNFDNYHIFELYRFAIIFAFEN